MTSKLLNTLWFDHKTGQLRTDDLDVARNEGESAVSNRFGILRNDAFNRAIENVVAERHYYRTNFLAIGDPFIEWLGQRERYLLAKGANVAIHVDLLGIESNWTYATRNTELDLERFRRSVQLVGYSGKGDPEDYTMIARRNYVVGPNQKLEGAGLTVARADYESLTEDHYSTIDRVNRQWQLSQRSNGAFSMAFFDRIDAPEYSVWRKYKDGSVMSLQVSGRFLTDVDLDSTGTMTNDPRTYAEFERDRLSRRPLIDNPLRIIETASDPRALRKSMESFNIWSLGANDTTIWNH